MKKDYLVLHKVDGTKEKINHFILIKCKVDHPPYMGKCVSNIPIKFHVADILGDHSRWEHEERMKSL